MSSTNPLNANTSGSMDIPQATLASATATPMNAENETNHLNVEKSATQSQNGNLVMEVKYSNGKSNEAFNSVSNKSLSIFSQEAVVQPSSSSFSFAPQVATSAANAAAATPKNKAEVESSTSTTNNASAKTHSSSTKPPSSTKTPQSKSSTPIVSPKVPKYLIKSSNGRVTYLIMIHEAIVELADRTGSSIPAIQKFMKNKHEYLQNLKPKTFSNSVNSAIKAGMKEGRFVKVKNSFKMNSAWVRKQKDMYKVKEAKKKAAEKKRKMEAEKAKAEKEKKIKQEKEKKIKQEKEEKAKQKAKAVAVTEDQRAAEEKKKLDLILAERKRAAAQKKAQEIAEKIKKRRFPMDDRKLIAEDKELGVKRPADKSKQPFLPFTLSSIIPCDDRPPTRKTTSSMVVNACTGTMSQSSRSVVSDLIQIYHFFRGDVGFGRIYPNSVPDFSFNHLLQATNEVMIGNMKKSQLVPPLLGQLFHASLDILTDPEGRLLFSAKSLST